MKNFEKTKDGSHFWGGGSLMANIFRRLFGKKEGEPPQLQTAPLTSEEVKSVSAQSFQLKPSQLMVGIGESVGRQRDHNEDTIYALNAILTGTNDGVPFGIFIIADGMGGHLHGEIASNLAVKTMSEYLVQKLYIPIFGLNPEQFTEPIQEIMHRGVTKVQDAVIHKVSGGGTTLTAVFVLGEQVTISHVGDSRAYFITQNGEIQVITRDHSLVRRLIELGQITEEEALVHPQRNVLYRAIGQGEPFEPDISTVLFPRPGYLMLCSDGLWSNVKESEISRIVTSQVNPSIACQELVEAANMAGGPDNISVILVYYPN